MARFEEVAGKVFWALGTLLVAVGALGFVWGILDSQYPELLNPAPVPAHPIKKSLASEYALCAAYHMIHRSVLADNSMDTSKVEAVARNALNMAVTLSNQKVTTARLELFTKMMMEDMQNSWSNYAVLTRNYGPLCKQLTENPVQRLEYWRNK